MYPLPMDGFRLTYTTGACTQDVMVKYTTKADQLLPLEVQNQHS